MFGHISILIEASTVGSPPSGHFPAIPALLSLYNLKYMEEYRQRKGHRTKRLQPADYCPELPLDLADPKDSATDSYRRSRIRKGHSQRPWRYSCGCMRRKRSPSARRRLLIKELRLAFEPESLY